MHGDRKDDAKQSAVKMRVMIDIIAASFGHEHRVAQEYEGINDGGYGNDQHLYGSPGPQEDEGEQHGGNRAGSPQAPVIIVIATPQISGDICYDQGPRVQDQVIKMG